MFLSEELTVGLRRRAAGNRTRSSLARDQPARGTRCGGKHGSGGDDERADNTRVGGHREGESCGWGEYAVNIHGGDRSCRSRDILVASSVDGGEHTIGSNMGGERVRSNAGSDGRANTTRVRGHRASNSNRGGEVTSNINSDGEWTIVCGAVSCASGSCSICKFATSSRVTCADGERSSYSSPGE